MKRDFAAAGQPRHGPTALQGDPFPERLEGNGPVHRPGIQIKIAQTLSQPSGGRGFSRAGWTIDGDDEFLHFNASTAHLPTFSLGGLKPTAQQPTFPTSHQSFEALDLLEETIQR